MTGPGQLSAPAASSPLQQTGSSNSNSNRFNCNNALDSTPSPPPPGGVAGCRGSKECALGAATIATSVADVKG